jgi:PAS domain S-box-containing protein
LLDQVGATAGKILTQAVERETANDRLFRLVRQLEEAKEDLERINERYTNVANFAQVGIFEAYPDGVTYYMNEAGEAMEEIGDDESPNDWRKHLHPDHREEIEKQWDEFNSRCRAEIGPDYYELDEVFLARDGTDRVFAVRAQALRRDGRLEGFVGVLTDVTKIREKEQELTIRLGEINHDIRNGLTGLEDALNRLRSIGHGGEVDDCLDLADACRRNIAELAQSAGKIEPVEFDLHLEAKVFELRSNKTTRMRVEAVKSNSTLLRFCVEDNGPGLPEDMRSQLGKSPGTIRRKYTKLDPSEHGRGLMHCQLALAQLAVESRLAFLEGRVQGRFDGQPAFNKIQFTVRVEECPPAADPDRTSARILEGRGPVLLVDDDVQVRAGLAWKLLSWGIHPITVVASGDDAVRAAGAAWAAENPYELILMDIRLGPGIDGYQATEKIRELELARPRPCHILSISVLSEDDEEKRRSARIDGQVSKTRLRQPVDLIREWLPGLVSDRPPAPRADEADSWVDELGRLDHPIQFRLLGSLALVSALTRQGRVPEQSAREIAHRWKTEVESYAGGLVKAVGDAQNSQDPFQSLELLLNEAIFVVFHQLAN